MRATKFIAILMIALSTSTFAGITGKIAGTVIDEQTNEPLIGVNVFIEELAIGATTAIDLALMQEVLQASEEVTVVDERLLLREDEFTNHDLGRTLMREKFRRLFGDVPSDKSDFRHRHRLHQGWWRTSVLVEEEGPHPTRSKETVCNTFNLRDDNAHGNYLNGAIAGVVQASIDARKGQKNLPGLIQEPRIWNNLLSSQPLAFNFWAPLKIKPELANKVLPELIPGFKSLIDIEFEWAPQQKYTGDRSAFDVLIKYIDTNETEVWLGLEVKYTDTLSGEPHDHEEYRALYKRYHEDVFFKEYTEYIKPKYNQLFRNQLIACALHQHEQRQVRCGLFCSEKDESALRTAKDYQWMLVKGEEQFLVLTYEAFIAAVQQTHLTWEDRQWSMLLWARYLGMPLSKKTAEEMENPFD